MCVWYLMGRFRYQDSVSAPVKIIVLTSWSLVGSVHCEQDLGGRYEGGGGQGFNEP